MLTKLEKDVAKFIMFFALTLVACKLTGGAFAGFLAVWGCFAMFAGSVKWTVVCFVFMPMLIFFSPALVAGPFLGSSARIGQIVMSLCMLFSPAIRRRRDYIPIGVLFLYCLVATISSMDGWMPLISYLKIANFALFLVGISVIGRMMQHSDETLYQLRVVLLALAFFILVGSVLAYFIPSVGYSMEVQKAEGWGIYTTGADVAAREGKSLFNGVMNHSQTLATNVPFWFGWALCDMLLNERKVTRLHLIMFAVAPVLMYMSRSRTALVVFVASLAMIWMFLLPRIQLSASVRTRIKGAFYLLVLIIALGFTYSQIKNQTLSKWLRKEDDVASDTRGLLDAVTATRMGLVEYNLNDFRLNPVLGKGFQVMDWHADAYMTGRISWLSAPIEKGVLPLMVLGETGIVGGIVFLVFICVFYRTCIKRKYVCLMCLFTALMAANMSEAGFFSPGGGTAQWTSTVIGGFCLDMIAKRRRNELPFGGGRYESA